MRWRGSLRFQLPQTPWTSSRRAKPWKTPVILAPFANCNCLATQPCVKEESRSMLLQAVSCYP